MFYKRANKIAGKGQATVIGKDGKQILLKHGSFYVTLHSCHNRQLEDSFSNISAQPVHLHPESETLSPSKFSENLADMNYDSHLSSNVNENTNFNPTDNVNSVEKQVSSQNREHNFQNNDINELALKYTSTEKPNIKQYVKYEEVDSNDIVHAQMSTGGKASRKKTTV